MAADPAVAGMLRRRETPSGTLPSMSAQASQPPLPVRPDGSPLRVLVVDDEPSLAELLATVLRLDGWAVRTAGDGSSAVREAREFRPDVAVLDVMLPDFDGFEVLRRIHAEDPEVCVLFLTARDAVEDRVTGITAGADDYVTKPFSIEEVLIPAPNPREVRAWAWRSLRPWLPRTAARRG